MPHKISYYKKLFLQIIGLQSSRGRLIAFAIGSSIIYLLPFRVVGQFSLIAKLGWESAPSVGLTRAYWLIIHGQPSAAWDRNWLIFPVLAVICIVLARDIFKLTKTYERSE